MIAKLEWKGNLLFDADVPSGSEVSFDGGEGSAAPSPMEGLLTSLAACTAMDVISILEKKRQKVTSYRVEIEGERKPPGEWPRPFEAFRIKHIVEGEVDEKALERAIDLSATKYCSVSATFGFNPEITNSWEIS